MEAGSFGTKGRPVCEAIIAFERDLGVGRRTCAPRYRLSAAPGIAGDLARRAYS